MNRLTSFVLPQPRRKMRPYQYDKMFEINHEFYLIELNIDLLIFPLVQFEMM